MARIRSIKPGFFVNEEVASLSFEWRLLFIGLWTQADRAGRLEDRPLRLKASLFPYDSIEIEVGLTRLAEVGLIVRYQVGDQRLIAVPTFAKHQQPHVREADSELPPPEHVPSTVPAPGQHLRNGSGNGSGKGADPEECAMPHAASAPTALLVFPTTGSGAKEWALTSTQLDEWATAYPALDVTAEARKALAWVKANAGHRKTAKGMPSFLVRWFNRAVDNGQTRPSPSSRLVAPGMVPGAVDKYAGRTHGLDRHDTDD